MPYMGITREAFAGSAAEQDQGSDPVDVRVDATVGDGATPFIWTSEVFGRLLEQTSVREDQEAYPGDDLAQNLRSLPVWQLQSMIDEQDRIVRELRNLASRARLVRQMIQEQAGVLAQYDPQDESYDVKLAEQTKTAADIGMHLRGPSARG